MLFRLTHLNENWKKANQLEEALVFLLAFHSHLQPNFLESIKKLCTEFH